MDVGIEEPRREHEAVGLDHPVPVRTQARSELRDRAAVDADVQDRVHALALIDDAGAADDEVVLGSMPCVEEGHHATSWSASTLTPTGPLVSRS
jgi:hypothetical protein